jgi:repressor LexA
MFGLSKSQREILDFISDYQLRHGFTPSIQDIVDGTGRKGKANVHRILQKLEERGRIRRLPNKARSIEVVRERNFSDKA